MTMSLLSNPTGAAILATVSLAGCVAVGPNFKPPAAPAATGYLAPAERTVAAANAALPDDRQVTDPGAQVTADWWTLFASPQLDLLVKQAIAGSPSLDSAKARLAQAQEEVRAAQGARYPQAGLSASAAHAKESAAAFGLSASAFPLPPNYNILQVGPSASYDLDVFGGVRRGIEQRSALAELQSDRLDAAYLTLTGNTVSQALEIAAIRAELKAADDILDIDRQNLDLVTKERDAGEAPGSDVVLARSQLAADETLKPGLEQQLSAAQHALAVLLGHSPGAVSPPDLDLTALTLPGRLPVSLPSDLVHQRPDIRAAEAELHASSAQIGVATARLYPDITLSAGITASSLDGSALFDNSGLVWSLAAGITQPLFDGGTRRAERRAALDGFKADAADYRQTVLSAFSQVADILTALAHDADLVAAEQQALDTASESVRLQRRSYTGGGTGILNLLDAQRQRDQALLGYVRAQAQRYEDTVQLLVAMGGGWWKADLTAASSPSRALARTPPPS
jgi:NodT family efflux transporter outer membrane factor (OMF) lipoprotein